VFLFLLCALLICIFSCVCVFSIVSLFFYFTSALSVGFRGLLSPCGTMI
jgi:hypothetical protein